MHIPIKYTNNFISGKSIFASFLIVFSLNNCTSIKNDDPSKTMWSVKMANSVMAEYDSLYKYQSNNKRWQYDIAMLGQAINKLNDHDPRYGQYHINYIDMLIDDNGQIYRYDPEEYNIDNINPAKSLFILYNNTGEEKYRKAIELVMQQLKSHPKTKTEGYWHKKKYPWQMWLDGIYMASPFMVQYANEFNRPEWFDIATHQAKLIYKKTFDPQTGLLYHAWDESKTQAWCDTITGQSKNFWSRGLGWYMMAIVDVLDYLPEDHPDRDSIIINLQQISNALLKVRDPETGLWYQVLDKGGSEGNYIETSGSSMFLYAFAKGASKGYLENKYFDIAKSSFENLTSQFIIVRDEKLVMKNICGSCGLGGERYYRDGSYQYYINEKKVNNDPKGVASFILAAQEIGL